MDLNIRNVSDGLVYSLKAMALSERVTLREFVIGILERDVKRGGETVAPAEEPIKIISPTKESASQKSASPFDESASAIKTAAAPAPGGCPKHGPECGWRKAGGWWCSKDGQVY